jgi:hypothetical protein
MIYYRVALQADQSSTWRWKSTVLASLEALFGFLRLYSMVPRDRIRVFYSSSVEYMDPMLDRENKGLASNSLTAEQLLNGRKSINSQEMTRLESEPGTRESIAIVVTALAREQSAHERSVSSQLDSSMSSLDMRRLELELGLIGDHDTPYEFALPTSMPQALAWTKLLVKVQAGELEP